MKTFLTLCLMLTLGVAAGTDSEDILVEGNTNFAAEMYRLMTETGGNVFFSPYSISSALAMTYAGARANTAREMSEALHFPEGQGELHSGFQSLNSRFENIRKSGTLQLTVANALWIQTGYRLLPEFTGINQDYYAAHLYRVDFIKDPNASRLRINGWVEDKTRGKIKDLLAPSVIKDLTRLVLTNAIHFLAKWARKFDPNDTQTLDFWVTPKRGVKVAMMSQDSFFPYQEYDSHQVLEMPYQGGRLSMFVCLPKKIDGLEELEEQLNLGTIKEWMSRHPSRQIKVFFPKFKSTGEYSLKDYLTALGMKDAFTDKADFSGIEPKKELKIDAVIHKTFIDVDEVGTEAAAATAVVMEVQSALPQPEIPEFRADHPFLYFICDNQTGTILFMGRMVDPEKP
jgi:serpin B